MEQGDLLKKYGIERVEAHCWDFVERVREQAKVISQRQGHVTTDDLRLWANLHDIYPLHQNAWGAIFRPPNEWQLRGYMKSKIPSNHARRIGIWRWKMNEKCLEKNQT